MSTREQFLPSKWITNPKHLPLFSTYNSSINTKDNATTLSTSAVSSFFTSIAKEGAFASITGADTYVTVCDLTGAGFMGSCISPGNASMHTPTIRLTVDGEVYVLTPPGGDITAAHRLVLGSFTTVGIIASTAGGDKTASLGDSGFATASSGGLPVITSCNINRPTNNLAEGLLMLRFETGLKVEMKDSLLSGDAQLVKCAVTYRMDV